jgi:hypothetical protein
MRRHRGADRVDEPSGRALVSTPGTEIAPVLIRSSPAHESRCGALKSPMLSQRAHHPAIRLATRA